MQFKIFNSSTDEKGNILGAMSMATAAHVASVIDILCQGHLPQTGVILHDEITIDILQKSHFFAPLSG